MYEEVPNLAIDSKVGIKSFEKDTILKSYDGNYQRVTSSPAAGECWETPEAYKLLLIPSLPCEYHRS